MKNKFKWIKALTLLGVLSITLTACKSKPAPQFSNDSDSGQQQQKKTVAMELARGKITQSAGIMTIPIVLKNTGTNSTVINSQNFTLKIQGYKFKPMKIPGEASDYHLDFDQGNVFNNTISFYLGKKLTSSQLKYVQLYYKLDNGKEVKATQLTNSTSQNELQASYNQKSTDIGTYYKNIKDYTQQVKKAEKTGEQPASLNNTFQDSNYDRFKMWCVVPNKDSSNVIIKVLNQTNTDIEIPFDDIELSDKENDETRISPSYRNYTLLIPHGKYAMVTVPLESKVSKAGEPFTVKVRTNNADFFSTSDAIYPIETVFSENGSDISKLFSLTPDEYIKSQISWSNPKLDIDGNTLDVTVQVKDYFALRFKPKRFTLIGYNDDGTIGDKEISIHASPTSVSTSDPTKITIRFKDLSLLRQYTHIELKYKNRSLLKVK